MAISSNSFGRSHHDSLSRLILAIIGLVSLWPEHPIIAIILGFLWLLGL